MKRWGFLLIGALATITLAVVHMHHARGKRLQQQRDVIYQELLRSYSGVLKTGTSRKEVEDYLRGRNTRFQQMCCVPSKDSSSGVLDDLTRIGAESAPWPCAEKNIYVAFQFTGSKRRPSEVTAEDPDTLKAVTIYRSLEDCP